MSGWDVIFTRLPKLMKVGSAFTGMAHSESVDKLTSNWLDRFYSWQVKSIPQLALLQDQGA